MLTLILCTTYYYNTLSSLVLVFCMNPTKYLMVLAFTKGETFRVML